MLQGGQLRVAISLPFIQLINLAVNFIDDLSLLQEGLVFLAKRLFYLLSLICLLLELLRLHLVLLVGVALQLALLMVHFLQLFVLIKQFLVRVGQRLKILQALRL